MSSSEVARTYLGIFLFFTGVLEIVNHPKQQDLISDILGIILVVLGSNLFLEMNRRSLRRSAPKSRSDAQRKAHHDHQA